MPVYSHSQLSTFEECPLKFKLSYIDKIKRDTPNIEAFMGSIIHNVLRKCYDNVRFTRVDTLDDLLSTYNVLWQKNWNPDTVINKKGLTPEHYQELGRNMLQTYYRHYAPFKSDLTIGTELQLYFSLDNQNKYRFTGFIDRLSRNVDGIYCIHDYKTSSHLPGQEDADNDRQLALYQIGIHKKWPHIDKVTLSWHYLAFDQEIKSQRSEIELSNLINETTNLIDTVETTEEFLPRESPLCDWCQYPDLCPSRKHWHAVECMSPTEYKNNPGILLVNRYAELKEKAADIENEMDIIKESLTGYAKNNGITLVRGSSHQIRIKFDKKLKFPGKNDPERTELNQTLLKSDKWMEVSQLDVTALTRVIEEKSWDKDLIDSVIKFGKIEEISSLYLSKLKEKEL